MSARPRSAVRALLLGVVGALSFDALQASRVHTLTLPEMVEVSGAIFAGEVVRTEPVAVEGLPVTAVTFRVDEAVRGTEAGASLTLRFLGGPRPAGGIPYRIAGSPAWSVGDRVVLLAHPASDLGLTAPAGLFQGRFDLVPGPLGSEMAVQAVPSRRLLDGVPDALLRDAGLAGPIAGPLPRGALLHLVRDLARSSPAPGRP